MKLNADFNFILNQYDGFSVFLSCQYEWWFFGQFINVERTYSNRSNFHFWNWFQQFQNWKWSDLKWLKRNNKTVLILRSSNIKPEMKPKVQLGCEKFVRYVRQFDTLTDRLTLHYTFFIRTHFIRTNRLKMTKNLRTN